MAEDPIRCPWCLKDPLYVAYHDLEWGVPEREELKVFEHLCLETFQCGLSWLLVLRRRRHLRAALLGFDPEALAPWGEGEISAALQAEGMIRCVSKVRGVVRNARALLGLWNRGLRLSDLVWSPFGGETRVNRRRLGEALPASTPESEDLSRRLRGLGFSFVGPVVCYSLMQALGVVDDHVVECVRHPSRRG